MNKPDIVNPFIEMNEGRTDLFIPKFKTAKRVIVPISLSEEALKHLEKIILEKANSKKFSLGVSNLLEKIGLGVLVVLEPKNLIDPESGVSTEECRQAGYEDGLAKEYSRFIQLFGNIGDEFQQAYVRGYFEGSFIRTTYNE
jgi:hypothetical protein